MKKINSMLRKCKTLSRQLGRTSSYSSLRSKSTRGPSRYYQELWGDDANMQEIKEPCETILVGSSRRRYVISSKHLNHPLLNALIQKSKQEQGPGPDPDPDLSVKCEVVLFDHLLWMLENADPNLITSDSLEELAELYVY
ncbi:Auxin-responsive protein SAUR76 [Sesamum alatum]|uniref:Auxin-responsive protein SAUR76 n=1 Tax=Sesamum alatum TaxID=300844 RepID=A0AAE1YZJ5_9LAMI|nr:Auxin-responsive protein SAUR76 [Sesamum alatum]